MGGWGVSGATAALTLAGAWMLAPQGVAAQERSIVSHEVAFSSGEAALSVEYSNGEALSISFRDQIININGEAVGEYESGSVLEGAWRSLLGRTVALSDGPLAAALAEWAPPEGLEGTALELAQSIDRALESGLVEAANPQAAAGAQSAQELPIAEVLASRLSLRDILDVLRDIDLDDDDLRIYSDRDLQLAAGEMLDGPVVLVDGSAVIDGRIRGDLIVVDGDVSLSGAGEITGDLHLLDSDLVLNRGEVLGAIRDIELVVDRGVLSNEIRAELRDEIRREVSQVQSSSRSNRGPFSRWLRNAMRGLGDAFQGVIAFLVLTLIGGVVVSFAGDRLNTIADAARSDPFRAGAVGFAGFFLAAPVFILGIIALAVSIVGILAIPFWVALFPIAVGLAAFLGFLAVCRNVGEWLSTTRYQMTEWIRSSNSFYTVTGGLAAFSLLFIVAHLLRIIPIFGALHGMVAFIGTLAVMAAGTVGLGAVMITRGGRFAPNGGAHHDEEIHWHEDPSHDRGSWEDADFEVEDADEASDESASDDDGNGPDADDANDGADDDNPS